MKFVFIGLDNIENRYLYGGYDYHKYSTAVFLPNNIRKVAKAFTLTKVKGRPLEMPFANQYYKRRIQNRIEQKGWQDADDLVFVIYSRDYESYGDGLVDFLRITYHHATIVCYFVDLIASHVVDIDHVKHICDGVFSFDQGEAEKYGIKWCMEPFSYVMLDRMNKNLPMKWDVTMVAAAKDRMPQIIELYEALRERGFICDFHVARAAEEEMVYEDEIDYHPIGFEELIRHVIQSKCTIELLQGDAVSPTTRYSETLLLDRMLLTNCAYLKDKQDEYENIIYFEKVEDIPFKRICQRVSLDREKYRYFLSNKAMMQTIAKGLE